MIFTDYMQAEKAPNKKCRFDITKSTDTHDFLSSILYNKRNPNKGGEAFNLVKPAKGWKESEQRDNAITKGSFNISSIYVPDIEKTVGYGDINGTSDAIIFQWQLNEDNEIISMELFIARGQKHNRNNLYFLYCDGEYTEEIEQLKKQSVPKTGTDQNGAK